MIIEGTCGGPQVSETFRQKELEWLEGQADLLQSLAGNWIVVEGAELITAGPDYREVIREARGKGISIPFVLYLSKENGGYLMGI